SITPSRRARRLRRMACSPLGGDKVIGWSGTLEGVGDRAFPYSVTLSPSARSPAKGHDTRPPPGMREIRPRHGKCNKSTREHGPPVGEGGKVPRYVRSEEMAK